MRLEELLQEAMSIANVDFSKDAKKDGDDYVVRTTVGDAQYEIRLYPARSKPALKAGARLESTWAMQFRIHRTRGVLRKSAAPATVADYKMQNFNSGQEFKLMPIVMGYLIDFIKTKSPDAFMFAADADEKSRVSLYKALTKRYQKELSRLGYRLLSDEEAKDARNPASLIPFVFVRNDLEADDDY